MNIVEQEEIHGWLESYVDALRADHHGDQTTQDAQAAVADEIERDLQSHQDVFQPEKVGIKRIRSSVTQGGVELSYNGTPIDRFGDDVKLIPEGVSDAEYTEVIAGFAGRPDSYWIDCAKRFFYEGRRDGHRLHSPLKTRDAEGLVAALEAAAEKVSRLRHPIFGGNQSWVLDLNRTHARAIAAGYMTGLPFRALGNQVSALSGQVYAEIYWTERRMDQKLDIHEYLPRLLKTLDKAFVEGRVKEEANENGAILTRGYIAEERFYKFADSANGWEYLSTGREPYSQTAINVETREITNYSEGDHVTAACPTDEIFCKELASVVRFWHGINPSVVDDMTDSLKAWLERPESGFEAVSKANHRPAA